MFMERVIRRDSQSARRGDRLSMSCAPTRGLQRMSKRVLPIA
jgi:hypothetical protein